MSIDSNTKTTFLGWHKLLEYEVFGLFQQLSDSYWIFNSCDGSLRVKADIRRSKMATEGEVKERLANFSPKEV